MLRVVEAVIRRDLLLAYRRRADVLTALVFFVIVVSLFPLGVGPEMNTLRLIAPGVIWVAALLASMLSLNRLFAADYQDGSLEQMALVPEPLGLIVFGKVVAGQAVVDAIRQGERIISETVAHWLVSGVPLALIAPLLGLQFGLPADALGVLVAALLLGTPVLSFIGAIGAALTLGLRGGGVLLSVLVLPLYVPVLIFGAGAVEAHMAGASVEGHFSLLGAILILAALATPWVTAAALRIALE